MVRTAILNSDCLTLDERVECYFEVIDLKYSIMNVCPVR